MPNRLLLADDSVTIQKVVGISFANEDIELVTVDNGDDAIQRIRETRPQVILADVVMPGKNGYEVCEAVKSDTDLRHIPVLLLTGTFEAFDEERAQRAGADGHITKPFEAQTLVDRVNELLASAPAAPSDAEAATVTVDVPSEAASPYDFFDDELTDPGSRASVADSAVEADDLEFGADEGEAFVFQEGDPESLDAPAAEAVDADEAVEIGGEPPAATVWDDPPEEATVALVPESETPSADAEPVVDAADLEDLDLDESLHPESSGPDADATPPAGDPSEELDDLFGTPISHDTGSDEPSAPFSFETPPASSESGRGLGLEPPDELDLGAQEALSAPGGSGTPEAGERETVVNPLSASEFDVSSSDLGDSLANGTPPLPHPLLGAPMSLTENPIASLPTAESAPAELETALSTPAQELPPALRQQLRETLEKIAWEAFGDLADSLVKQTVARVEAIAWEVIPQMAEALIQEEIRKLKDE